MRRPDLIARQGRCPSGLLGRLIARVMAAETAAANDEALHLLSLQPADHVLEVGFGHGRTIERIAAAVPRGFVAGVDLSRDMLRMASQRNRRAVAAGRVDLRHGDSERLPYPDCRFDKACSVHTLYFWTEPGRHLREIRRVMKPGGRFVLGFRAAGDPHAADFPPSVYRFYSREQVRSLLLEAGFALAQCDVQAADGTWLAVAEVGEGSV